MCFDLGQLFAIDFELVNDPVEGVQIFFVPTNAMMHLGQHLLAQSSVYRALLISEESKN
jgi:hypothetical protein